MDPLQEQDMLVRIVDPAKSNLFARGSIFSDIYNNHSSFLVEPVDDAAKKAFQWRENLVVDFQPGGTTKDFGFTCWQDTNPWTEYGLMELLKWRKSMIGRVFKVRLFATTYHGDLLCELPEEGTE